MIETPVRYFPISPQKVKRTSVGEGFAALWALARGRFTRRLPSETPAADAVADSLIPVATKLRKSSALR